MAYYTVGVVDAYEVVVEAASADEARKLAPKQAGRCMPLVLQDRNLGMYVPAFRRMFVKVEERTTPDAKSQNELLLGIREGYV